MIVDKYTPKPLGKKFSLSLKVMNFIIPLKDKHSPQSPEAGPGLTQSLESETKNRGKEGF